jgi:hypothetical protein
MEDQTSDASSISRCAGCGAQITAADAESGRCPHCGEAIVDPPALTSPANDEFAVIADDEEESEKEAETTKEEELSALRIHQISALRRGAYRARSHCIVIAAAFLFCAIELGIMAVKNLRTHGHRVFLTAYVATAVLALFFAGKLFRRIRELTQEVNQPLLADPAEPPDFSTLSDGSQHAQHLAQMHSENPQSPPATAPDWLPGMTRDPHR